MSVTGVRDRPPGYLSPGAFFFPPFTGQPYSASVTPGDLSFITVTGTFLSLAGVPASGTARFTPVVTPLKDVAAAVFTGGAVTATLNASGSFAVSITCTGNNDLLPLAWTYTITTTINGTVSTYPGKQIPYSPNSSIDLSDLLP